MRPRILAFLCATLPLLWTAAPAQALTGLTTGFDAQSVFLSGAAATQSLWFGRAAAEGARIVRINVNWSLVAPATPPAGFAPSDPSSPGYDWTAVDSEVRALAAGHMQVLMTILSAPAWAEGPAMPAGTAPGTWEPNAAQFGAFASAAARRYSGHFPDPLVPGSFLPRVRYWQPWNEPNLSTYLTPQWVPASQSFTAESPVIYRRLLNSFYAAVKAVSPANFVVSAGTAPYGDPPGGERVPPVAFDRDLFCLNDNARLTPQSCPDPPHLDALSHHPYGVGGPLWHALNPDDAAVPDLYKIARVLNAAERAHHVLPGGRKHLWVTEVSWDSKPPDPGGIPINRQARWVEQTMYVLWSQGVDTILWLQIIDSPPVPSYGTTNQGGMYYLDGQAKPAAQAMRFPFVTQRLSRGNVEAWGRAPKGGWLTIQIRSAGRWHSVRRLRLRAHQVFRVALPIRGGATMRAEIGGQRSLTWTQSV